MTLRHLLAGVALAAALAAPAFAASPRLKPIASVDADTVRLSDLIEGLDQRGEVPLFAAPTPGGRGTIRAERVLEAARELGIEGIDTAEVRLVTITRPGRGIGRAEMQDLILKAFSAERGAGSFDLTLDERITPRMLDARKAANLQATIVSRDPRAGRFEARIAAKDGTETWTVTGSYAEMREIAVPAADLERGDAVQAKDIALVKRPAGQIPTDIIADPAEVVGLIPRRTLRAGEPIRQADIAKPLMVEKNQIVTVTYATRGLALSMRGRAQSSGAKGETIRVQNIQSKRLIEGQITGPAHVTISAPPPRPETVADAQGAAPR